MSNTPLPKSRGEIEIVQLSETGTLRPPFHLLAAAGIEPGSVVWLEIVPGGILIRPYSRAEGSSCAKTPA